MPAIIPPPPTVLAFFGITTWNSIDNVAALHWSE
jgi:hypothetical protein